MLHRESTGAELRVGMVWFQQTYGKGSLVNVASVIV